MFISEDLCPTCKERYKPQLLYEAIPIDLGLIHYYYLYDELLLKQSRKRYLEKHLWILFDTYARDAHMYDLMVYLDDDLYFDQIINHGFLQSFSSIFMFSLEGKALFYQWYM